MCSCERFVYCAEGYEGKVRVTGKPSGDVFLGERDRGKEEVLGIDISGRKRRMDLRQVVKSTDEYEGQARVNAKGKRGSGRGRKRTR